MGIGIAKLGAILRYNIFQRDRVIRLRDSVSNVTQARSTVINILDWAEFRSRAVFGPGRS